MAELRHTIRDPKKLCAIIQAHQTGQPIPYSMDDTVISNENTRDDTVISNENTRDDTVISNENNLIGGIY